MDLQDAMQQVTADAEALAEIVERLSGIEAWAGEEAGRLAQGFGGDHSLTQKTQLVHEQAGVVGGILQGGTVEIDLLKDQIAALDVD
jgi:uncharacterized protein with LGFP repeats